MKTLSLVLLSYAFSFSAFALTSGEYVNKSFSTNDAQMYNSLKIDTTKCDKGGAIVKFYGADSMNFCVGNESKQVNVYKKCNGKELPYPFGGCIGIKTKVTYTTLKSVEINEKGKIVQTEAQFVDKDLVFEQSRTLIEENNNIRIMSAFESHKDGRKGSEEFVFEKID